MIKSYFFLNYIKSSCSIYSEGNNFVRVLRKAIIFVNYVLAETYCYNLSRRQDANLRPSAPKVIVYYQ